MKTHAVEERQMDSVHAKNNHQIPQRITRGRTYTTHTLKGWEKMQEAATLSVSAVLYSEEKVFEQMKSFTKVWWKQYINDNAKNLPHCLPIRDVSFLWMRGKFSLMCIDSSQKFDSAYLNLLHSLQCRSPLSSSSSSSISSTGLVKGQEWWDTRPVAGGMMKCWWKKKRYRIHSNPPVLLLRPAYPIARFMMLISRFRQRLRSGSCLLLPLGRAFLRICWCCCCRCWCCYWCCCSVLSVRWWICRHFCNRSITNFPLRLSWGAKDGRLSFALTRHFISAGVKLKCIQFKQNASIAPNVCN